MNRHRTKCHPSVSLTVMIVGLLLILCIPIQATELTYENEAPQNQQNEQRSAQNFEEQQELLNDQEVLIKKLNGSVISSLSKHKEC